MPRKGLSHRYYDDESSASILAPQPQLCALCQREIPASQRDPHHLTPKSRGGRSTIALHRICHRQIHALFTETELARRLNSIDSLLQEEPIQRFVLWVKRKPPGFALRTSKSSRLRGE
jgi:hypothetical protein